jgi:hypothetical protein
VTNINTTPMIGKGLIAAAIASASTLPMACLTGAILADPTPARSPHLQLSRVVRER